ncbi:MULTISPECIES: SDR family NAD(P)-dependent oxidoreductase [Micrococcaceae]|uniref:SDR family NAD(P)-dependent oxidoreductase n=1 Tax=Micrococcaceae TaxID=1268 RepID=UPI000A8FF0C3|nr:MULTISPECIES: SDR family NAD(P)-dependent oxidoreductase [Micrococcaceae]
MSNVVSGQTAIVTGAAGGIGSAVVNKFVQAGINVVAVDLQQSNLDGLLDRTAGG